MPYTIRWDDGGVRWTYGGVVTWAELLSSNAEIYRDPRFARLRYQIVDLSGVSSLVVTCEDMETVAALDHSAATVNPAVRIAVVVRDEHARQLSACYEAVSSTSPWQHRIFDRLAEAEHWAQQRPDSAR